jgi:hypothetical protein
VETMNASEEGFMILEDLLPVAAVRKGADMDSCSRRFEPSSMGQVGPG